MWTPDDLDIRIIRALASPSSFQWDVRISYARVAAGLGIDEETVRNRLRHMNDVRFLQGWQLILNPNPKRRKALDSPAQKIGDCIRIWKLVRRNEHLVQSKMPE